jgi:signal transduction histidine kinase
MKTRDPIRKETNVYEIVDTVIATSEVSFSLKNNSFNNQIPKDLVVISDPQALQFILRNLIANANKFCENGTISVAAKKASGKINIMIADTGIGMSEEKAKNLFSSHKNFATPGTQNEMGSGLGLVLIKEFLDKIDGIINVTSVEGKGTTFSIVLNG